MTKNKARRLVAKRRHKQEKNNEAIRTPQPIPDGTPSKHRAKQGFSREAEDLEGGSYGQLEQRIMSNPNKHDKRLTTGRFAERDGYATIKVEDIIDSVSNLMGLPAKLVRY